MKSSCIAHPAEDYFLRVYDWQFEAADGNRCAAALLSFFEYWHNFRTAASAKAYHANAVAEQHGDAGTQDASLWQFHTMEQIEAGVKFFKRDAIRDAIKLLEEKGFVTTGRNPNPRYKFDRTQFFLFHPETVNEWLQTYTPLHLRKIATPSAENPRRSTENPRPSSESRRTIQKNPDKETIQDFSVSPARTREEEKLEEPPAKVEPAPTSADQVDELHAHYCATIKDVPLTPSLKVLYRNRIAESGLDYCKRVIDGCAADPWSERWRHNNPEVIFDSPKRMAMLIGYLDTPPASAGKGKQNGSNGGQFQTPTAGNHGTARDRATARQADRERRLAELRRQATMPVDHRPAADERFNRTADGTPGRPPDGDQK